MSSSFEPSGGSGNCQNSSSVYCFTSGDIFTQGHTHLLQECPRRSVYHIREKQKAKVRVPNVAFLSAYFCLCFFTFAFFSRLL